MSSLKPRTSPLETPRTWQGRVITRDLTLEDARQLASTPPQQAATFERISSNPQLPAAPRDDGNAMSLLQARALQDVPKSGLSVEKHAAVRDAVLRSLDDGSAVKLARMPHGLKGARPVVTDITHAASGTHGSAYVTHGMVYFERTSTTPSPLAGWWRIGIISD